MRQETLPTLFALLIGAARHPLRECGGRRCAASSETPCADAGRDVRGDRRRPHARAGCDDRRRRLHAARQNGRRGALRPPREEGRDELWSVCSPCVEEIPTLVPSRAASRTASTTSKPSRSPTPADAIASPCRRVRAQRPFDTDRATCAASTERLYPETWIGKEGLTRIDGARDWSSALALLIKATAEARDVGRSSSAPPAELPSTFNPPSASRRAAHRRRGRRSAPTDADPAERL